MKLSLLLSLLAGLLLAQPQAMARELNGDWESSGTRAAPSEPYKPGYAFKYECQAELSDLELRTSATNQDEEYRLVAVSRFSFDNDHSYVSGKNLEWKWVAVVFGQEEPREETLAAAPVGAFGTDELGVSLQLFRAPTGGKQDSVRLAAHVSAPHGAYAHQEMASQMGKRGDPQLSLDAEASLSRRLGQSPEDLPWTIDRRLHVTCKKIR